MTRKGAVVVVVGLLVGCSGGGFDVAALDDASSVDSAAADDGAATGDTATGDDATSDAADSATGDDDANAADADADAGAGVCPKPGGEPECVTDAECTLRGCGFVCCRADTLIRTCGYARDGGVCTK